MRTPAAVVCSLLVFGIASGPSAAGVPVGERGAHGARPDGAPAPWWSVEAAARAGGMSLDRAVEMVQRRYNAKVVRAEETRDGDDVVYRIRLLSEDGRVFTVRVNARTGQID